MYRKTYVEINVDNLEKNVKNILKQYNEYEYYIGVVKGNSYGYGNYIAKYLVQNGINYLATSSLEEALDIRKYVKEPILILEPIPIEFIDICLKNNFTITVSDYTYYKDLIKKDLKDLKIHLKINTGMNRLGLNNKDEIKEIYDYLLEKGNLEGIYTHLGTAGIIDKIWDNQLAKWYKLTSLIDLTKIKIVHIARSSTLVNHKKIAGTNGVRLGIMLFGIIQDPLTYHGLKGKIRKLKHEYLRKKLKISATFYNIPELYHTFNLCSEVMEIKNVKKGEIVGYGHLYIAQSDIKIAILPIGYADGLSLNLTNTDVEINGKLYKIVGTINCGMLTILVDNDVKIGDKVIIIGNNLKDIARKSKESAYSLTSKINPLLPRIYLKNKKTEIIEKEMI